MEHLYGLWTTAMKSESDLCSSSDESSASAHFICGVPPETHKTGQKQWFIISISFSLEVFWWSIKSIINELMI